MSRPRRPISRSGHRTSSGNTTQHRLHRGGDRQLNRALRTTAFNRYYSDPETISYVAKRTQEGKTPEKILRCLKRYIARSLFRKLNANAT